jgi:hypothetical protein
MPARINHATALALAPAFRPVPKLLPTPGGAGA